MFYPLSANVHGGGILHYGIAPFTSRALERDARSCMQRVMNALAYVGVLAIEVQNRSEQIGSVRALVTIFAAQLARWIQAGRPAELSDRRLA